MTDMFPPNSQNGIKAVGDKDPYWSCMWTGWFVTFCNSFDSKKTTQKIQKKIMISRTILVNQPTLFLRV